MDISLFEKNGIYPMIALDHRNSFRKLLFPEDPDNLDEAALIKGKKRILESIVGQFSACLIDSDIGLPAYQQIINEKDGDVPPYLLRLTRQTYGEENGEKVTEVVYTAKELKGQGASGIKLVLYINPFGEKADQQIAVAKKALEDAHSQGLPFFLEPVTYDLPVSEGKETGELILETLKNLKAAGVEPDVWKLEYPGSAEYSRKVTEMVEGVPWILLTRGTTFEEFKNSVKIASQEGARGFLAGRALWQEVGTFEGEAQDAFIEETIPERFAEITKIVETESKQKQDRT